MSQPQGGFGTPPLSNRNRNVLIAVGAVIIVALATVVIVVVTSGNNSAQAASVRTEPTSSAGSDPFAPAPVGTDQTIPPVQPAGTVTLEGGHVGLYGGTLNMKTCDKNQLTLFLQQNPDKADAWVSVLGITREQIPSYVAGLTPVLLRSDTLVTNHGFANGQVTVIPAVLQAGTAVLVDDKGFPVTKCYCGNPLTPPTYYSPGYKPTYYGPRWSRFSGQSITIIQNNTTVIQTFTLVDPTTKQPFNRPRGTDGTADTPGTGPAPTSAPVTSLPPQQLPTETVPSAPPVTQAPPTETPEQQAIDKLNNGAQQCQPFPAPIQQGYGQNSISTGMNDPNTFVLTVVTHNMDGSPLQTFTWSVSRSTLEFTPTNDLAQAASNYCAALR